MDAPSKLARTLENEGHHIRHETPIFYLPEPVFHYILSFLSLRDMAKASICCKAWRNLCYVTPYLTINFHELNVYPGTFMTRSLINYTNFVDRLLLLRKSPKLLSFSLNYTSGYPYDYHIESWILKAITSCNARELHLILPKWFTLPNQFFNVPKLEELVLNMNSQFLRFPPSIQWTKLHFLSLDSVMLPDDPFLDLLASCRCLKTLTLAFCSGFTTLTIISDSLTTFKIWDLLFYSEFRAVVIICNNLKTLHMELLLSSPAQSSIRLITPSLQLFKWHGPIVHRFSADFFLSVQSAMIDVLSHPLSNNELAAILEFGSGIFSCLRHVKSLCLCGLSMQILAMTMMHKASVSLSDVEYLKTSSHLDDTEAFLMKYILRRITTVKSLVINQDINNYQMVPISRDLYKEVKKFLKMEFVHQLKKARMRLLCSWESNMDFVNYLLKSGKDLETITLLFCPQLELECNVGKKVGKEIEALQVGRKILVLPI